MVCGERGYAMYAITMGPSKGKKYTYYACSYSRTKPLNGTCNNRHHFSTPRIDADVGQRLNVLLANKEKFNEAIDELNQGYNTQNQGIIDELDRIEASKAKRNRELEKAVDAYLALEEGATKDYLQKRSSDIELNLAELQARKETLETKLQGQRASRDRIVSLADTVTRIGREIEKADKLYKARRRFVADIFKVKVTLSYVDGKEDIQATCQLGPGLEYELKNYESCLSILK